MRTSLLKHFSVLLAPRSEDEDAARREFILNVLLGGMICIFAFATSHNTAEHFLGASNSMSLWALFLMLTFFVSLYGVSRMRMARLAAYLLIGLVLLFASYLGYKWGVDLPAGILLYVLAITMAGVLISTRAAFATTILVIGYMTLLGGMQASGNVVVDRTWALTGWHSAEISVAAVILLVIATVAWLGNREIEKSLKRAQHSERELMLERDQLEVRIAARTEELRKVELERMSQAYRFVEFGRLAGSIFHDLTNPLTALSLNIESIAKSTKNSLHVATFAEDVGRAQKAAKHMQNLMTSMRRHLAHEERNEAFSLYKMLSEMKHILTPYARTHSVTLMHTCSESLLLQGNPIAFQQAITNIISNAVESFSAVTAKDGEKERVVAIEVYEEGEAIQFVIRDNGPGMSAEVKARIFEPFFSTKQGSGGMGIGLVLAKQVIEKSFGGTIEVISEVDKGTIFKLHIPYTSRNAS